MGDKTKFRAGMAVFAAAVGVAGAVLLWVALGWKVTVGAVLVLWANNMTLARSLGRGPSVTVGGITMSAGLGGDFSDIADDLIARNKGRAA